MDNSGGNDSNQAWQDPGILPPPPSPISLPAPQASTMDNAFVVPPDVSPPPPNSSLPEIPPPSTMAVMPESPEAAPTPAASATPATFDVISVGDIVTDAFIRLLEEEAQTY